MVVCLCSGISDREVRRLIREGAGSRSDVESACGAGGGCGGCHPSLDAVIDEALDEFKKLESTVPEASPVHLFLASIHERRGETDLAFQEYSRAFEQEKFSFFGYRCDYCKRVAAEWGGTCPGCGRRNTYAIYWNTGDVNLVPFSGAPQ